MISNSLSAAPETSIAINAINTFEHRFNFATAEMSRSIQTASQALIDLSISELKQMTDCLAENLGISQGLPRRNSKISLARWVSEVLLGAIKVEDEFVVESEPLVPVEPEILPVEPKPVFEIVLLGNDDLFTKHWVSRIPLYLVTKDGNLFYSTGAKQTSPTIVIHYAQLVAEHLSNIQEGLLGTDIHLLSNNLSVAKHNINGHPPRYLITKEGGVYARRRLGYQLCPTAVQYDQLISEYLSNIEVVKR